MKEVVSLRGACRATWQSLSDCFCSLSMTLVCLVVLTGCNAQAKENKACYKRTCYVVELAISDEQKIKGLQKRDYLDKDRGMLFVLSGNAPQKFWMKETLIPLDMLWLDFDGKIIHIEHAAAPCEKDPCPSYGPNQSAFYVLEINATQAAAQDMRVGERISLELKKF